MTVANSARRGAQRVATSRPLEIAFRIGFVGYGLLHLAVAWLAVQLALGRPAGEHSQSGAFPPLVRHPFGQFLVAVAGLAILALGVGLAIYGAKRMFERRLMTYRMNEATRQSARRLGQFGYIAKGVAFAIVGLLLADAALSNNPAKSRGLDTALRTLIAQPFGQWLLILVAVGFAAFG